MSVGQIWENSCFGSSADWISLENLQRICKCCLKVNMRNAPGKQNVSATTQGHFFLIRELPFS